jgi:transcriptional regulator with XRE-family HTH domain
MILGDEMLRLRKAANLTVREAAAKAKLAFTTYSQVEHSRVGLSDGARERVSLAFGLPADHLFNAVFLCADCGQGPCVCVHEVIHCRRLPVNFSP